MEQPTRNTRRRQLSGLQITFAVILAVGMMLAINFSSRISAGQPLEAAYDRAEVEVEALREEQATLIAVRDFSRSEAFVEQWARGEGKMVREGETLVIPVPAGVPLQPTPIPVPTVPVQTTPPEPEPWMLWWALFFDSPPPARQ